MAFARDEMEYAEDLGVLTPTQLLVYETKHQQLEEAARKNSNDPYHQEFIQGLRREIRSLLQEWHKQRQRG